MAVNGLDKVACLVNPRDQVGDNRRTGLALVAGDAGEDGLAVIVAAVEADDVAVAVVLHLDLGVNAQQQCAHGLRRLRCGGLCCLNGGSLVSGGGDRRAAAAGQGGEGQGGSQDGAEQSGKGTVFHFVHLLLISLVFDRCFCLHLQITKTGKEKRGRGYLFSKNF